MGTLRVSGLAAYAMKRCSMKRKSIGYVIQSLSDCARTRILEAWSRSEPAKLEYQTLEWPNGQIFFFSVFPSAR